MKNTTPFKVGKVYKLRGTTSKYRCQDVYINEETAAATLLLQNTTTGWTITAHNVTLYADNSIEWEYSTGGYFDRQKARVS